MPVVIRQDPEEQAENADNDPTSSFVNPEPENELLPEMESISLAPLEASSEPRLLTKIKQQFKKQEKRDKIVKFREERGLQIKQEKQRQKHQNATVLYDQLAANQKERTAQKAAEREAEAKIEEFEKFAPAPRPPQQSESFLDGLLIIREIAKDASKLNDIPRESPSQSTASHPPIKPGTSAKSGHVAQTRKQTSRISTPPFEPGCSAPPRSSIPFASYQAPVTPYDPPAPPVQHSITEYNRVSLASRPELITPRGGGEGSRQFVPREASAKCDKAPLRKTDHNLW